MNSQALQKRIINGMLVTHSSIGERPNNEFRSALDHRSGEDLLRVETDTQYQEYPAYKIPGQRSRSWSIVSRLRN